MPRWPVAYSRPSAAASAICSVFDTMRMRRRSTRSATAPPDEHERQERRVGGEGAQPEIERIAQARVDQPGHGDVLGPGADAAQERADPDQAEVAEPERGQERGQGDAAEARDGIAGDGDPGGAGHSLLYSSVPFACPGCGAVVTRSPEAWAIRCPSCGGVIRARALDAFRARRARTRVQITGRPETRRRVEVPWSDEEAARLRRWLLWSTVLTLALVVVLFAAARWAAG